MKRDPRPILEKGIHKGVVELLRLTACRDVMWFAIRNEGKRGPVERGDLHAMGMKPGVADLAVIVRGVPHFLELKTESPKSKQSLEQVAFELECWMHEPSLAYAVARSLKEAEAVLQSWGAIRTVARRTAA